MFMKRMEELCKRMNDMDYSKVLVLFDDGVKILKILKRVKRVMVFYVGKDFDSVEEKCLSYYTKPLHSEYGDIHDSIRYIPGCDIIGNDIKRTNPGFHLFEDIQTKGYNSMGFQKSKIKPVRFISLFSKNDGIYIREKAFVNFEHRLRCLEGKSTMNILLDIIKERTWYRIIYVHYEKDVEFVFNMIDLLLEWDGYLIVNKKWMEEVYIGKYLQNFYQLIYVDNEEVIFQKLSFFFPKNLVIDKMFFPLSSNLLWKKLLLKHEELTVGEEWSHPCPEAKQVEFAELGRLIKYKTRRENNEIIFKKVCESFYEVSSRYSSFQEFCDWTEQIAKNHWVICTCLYKSETYLSLYFSNLNILIEWLEERGDTYTLIFCYSESEDNTYKMLLEFCRSNDNYIILKSPQVGDYRSVNIATARNLQLEVINRYLKMTRQMIVLDANYVNNKKLQIEILDKAMGRSDWDALFFNHDDYYDIWALSYDPYYINCWLFGNILDIMRNDIKEKLDSLKEDELYECISAFCGFGIYRFEKFKDCSYSGFMEFERFYSFNIEKNIRILQQKRLFLNPELPWDCEHKYFHLDGIEKHGARIRISSNFIFR